MTHNEARELLEGAALEAGGIDRLIAGDTPEAAALAGHLAACPECTEEFDRLRRSATILRAVIATQPPDDLKERTLAFVAAVGRPRGALAGAGAAAPAPAVAQPLEAPAPTPIRLREARARRRGPLGWLAATAALVVLSVGATAAVVQSQANTAGRQASLEIAGLAKVAQWTTHLNALPGVQHVVLAGRTAPDGRLPVGSIVFSPLTHQVVIVADGIAVPPPGSEYGCWVEIAGVRQRLGKMYVGEDLGYWVGTADVLAHVPVGSVFGISLGDAGVTGPTEPILLGTLNTT
jgi:hypothetical protein